MTLLDDYRDRFERALRSRGAFDADILDETRDHLLQCREEAEARGLTRDDAERHAVRRFGEPDTVAAAFVDRSHPTLDRLLVAVCALSVLAVAALTLSLAAFRPPHVNYAASAFLALIIVAQSAWTLITMKATVLSATTGSWLRLALSIGGALLTAIGMTALREVMASRHFEGYAVVVGALLVVQGALTIVHAIRGDGRSPLKRWV